MKYCLAALGLILVLNACNLTTTKNSATANKPVFHIDKENDPAVKQLQGEWLGIKVQVDARNQNLRFKIESFLDEMAEVVEQNPFAFNSDGSFFAGAPNGKILVYAGQRTSWQVLPPNIFIAAGSPLNETFVESIDKDTLILKSVIREAKEDDAKATVYYTFYRMDSKKVGGTHFYDSTINFWRFIPRESESRAVIVKKLKGMLQYASVYARSVHYSGSSIINTGKFDLPFRYYNGGVSLDDGFGYGSRFSEYFYTKEEADIGKAILEKAFDKITDYPKRAHYVLEYADFFTALAEVVE